MPPSAGRHKVGSWHWTAIAFAVLTGERQRLLTGDGIRGQGPQGPGQEWEESPSSPFSATHSWAFREGAGDRGQSQALQVRACRHLLPGTVGCPSWLPLAMRVLWDGGSLPIVIAADPIMLQKSDTRGRMERGAIKPLAGSIKVG